MDRMPARIGGMRFLAACSGCSTDADMIPMDDLAIPYEAPKELKIMAAAAPMAPKKGW
jgi:hypothetical protein